MHLFADVIKASASFSLLLSLQHVVLFFLHGHRGLLHLQVLHFPRTPTSGLLLIPLGQNQAQGHPSWPKVPGYCVFLTGHRTLTQLGFCDKEKRRDWVSGKRTDSLTSSGPQSSLQVFRVERKKSSSVDSLNEKRTLSSAGLSNPLSNEGVTSTVSLTHDRPASADYRQHSGAWRLDCYRQQNRTLGPSSKLTTELWSRAGKEKCENKAQSN